MLIVWAWIGILASEVAGLAAVLIASLAPGPRPVTSASPAAQGASIAAASIVAVALLVPALGDLQHRRDEADRSHETDAASWLAEALPALPHDAMIVSWWSTSTPLWYAQKVQGLRPDITIVDDRTMLDEDLGRAPDVIRRFLGTRPVYAIRLEGRDLDELTSQFDMTLVAGSGNVGVWVVHGPLAARQ
jgi:hypothetical protein